MPRDKLALGASELIDTVAMGSLESTSRQQKLLPQGGVSESRINPAIYRGRIDHDLLDLTGNQAQRTPMTFTLFCISTACISSA
jgi:hypothetical protein